MKHARRFPRLREGFAGQHLVALPRTVILAQERHPALGGLRVTDAGLFPRAHGHYVDRPEGVDSTLLILCTAGKGWVRFGTSPVRPVSANDLIWLPDGQPHAYGAATDHPWTITWVHIQGGEVDFWRDHLGFSLQGGIRSLPRENIGSTAGYFEETYRSIEQGYALPHLVAASAWVRAALVSAMRVTSSSLRGVAATERVAATVDWMREHAQRSIRLPELAALAGMSVPHYSALFRQMTGYAPVNYHLRLRIQRACRLLDVTGGSVAEIARAAGFEDPYYFSRMFRGIMGRSPRNYRKRLKG